MIDWKQCQCSDFPIDVDLGNIRRVGKQVYFRIHIEHTAMGVEAHTMNESIEQDLYTELMKRPDGAERILDIMAERVRREINRLIRESAVPWDERKQFQGKKRSL